MDVVYKVVVGLGAGWLAGAGIARLLFRGPARGHVVQQMKGVIALAATLVAYGFCELLHGYGFIAVFIAAQRIRREEREHDYQQALHSFNRDIEQLLMVVILVLLGGAAVGGLLKSLDSGAVMTALALVLVIRPLAGWLGLQRAGLGGRERLVVSAFGIRGIGSLYYLSYGLNHQRFAEGDKLWAIVGLWVLISVVLHGLTAGPVMRWVEES